MTGSLDKILLLTVAYHQLNRGIMKKPALRNDRFKSSTFNDTNWTSSSKNIGEYIFRRISLDQSNKKLQEIRPRHILSQLIINSDEINEYVNDYLQMIERRNKNIGLKVEKKSVGNQVPRRANLKRNTETNERTTYV